jgi:hypothetical protein
MKSMNRREGKKIAVMAAVMVGLMMVAFMPMVSAAVTSFTVTPSSGLAGAVDSYNALVTTTGVTSINITIPAGFIAVTPTTGGVLIAEVNFWNSSTKAYYGYATITANSANPTAQVDVLCKLGGDEVTTTQPISYAAGATNTFESGFACDTSSAIMKLPTETLNGSINITINCTGCPCFNDTWRLDDVMIAIRQFVKNPGAGDYDFIADGVTETVTITAPSGRGIVFRSGRWYLDTTGDHICNILFYYGRAGDTPLIGDVNQDGKEDIIVVRNGKWYVDINKDHTADVDFYYGKATDIPLVGDVNQDGKEDIIVVRDRHWYVDTNHDYTADVDFFYGKPTDIPLVGDVNQDGHDDIIVVRDRHWYVDTDFDHVANEDFYYGKATDIPLVGDDNQDGKADTIVVRNGKWYVDTNHDRVADVDFYYGKATDIPLVGDIG